MPTALDLIPVRALNQVTYCPRLYYLQYVDAVMPTNEHVEGGLFDHRRVDDPDLANRTRKDGDTARSRSVAALVRSARHHRRARRDRGEGRRALPRGDEARLGPARRRRPAHHLGQRRRAAVRQALLLEEAFGQPVPAGSSSTPASRERVEVPFTDELRAKTRAAIDLCRELVRPRRAAGTAAGRAAAPLLRLLARPGLPARGDALPDRPARSGRRRRAAAGRPDPRHPAVRRRGRAVRAGAGQLRRQAQRAPGRQEGRPGAEPRADARGPAGGASSATCRSPRRPWKRWSRTRSRSPT